MSKKGVWRLTILSLAIFIVLVALVRSTAPPKTNIEILPISDSNSNSIELICQSLSDQAWATLAPAELSYVPDKNNTIKLYIHATGKTITLPLEQYLTGVVAAEMPALFETEALKAQAIAARTYVSHRMKNGSCGRGDADICTDSSHCQAWLSDAQQKSLWGENYALYKEKVQAAVYATADKILTYNGQPINALYHAVSGGQTEDCAAVFSQALPYLVSVSSPGEQSDGNYYSQSSFTPSKLAVLLNASFPKAKISSSNMAAQLKILSYTESGRANQVKVGKTTVDATDFRLALGLKSTMFKISFSSGQILFDVTGYGHGVGMSQRGANTMAQQGKSYREILAHYYPGTVLG